MDTATIEHEIIELLAAARREGLYEDDPAWSEIDGRLELIGYDVTQ